MDIYAQGQGGRDSPPKRHKVIAMIEIVSPGNKSRQTELKAFVEKAIQALSNGIHLLIVDLFPPTDSRPSGYPSRHLGRG